MAQYGPFVMYTEAEIYETLADNRAGKLAGQAA
ncbi:MAG: pirin-like C-terminal cupin domain-containing protein [Thauera sp.]|nr:pirin-like C-terminal cupin domain-containing protein [Thauera sp.]